MAVKTKVVYTQQDLDRAVSAVADAAEAVMIATKEQMNADRALGAAKVKQTAMQATLTNATNLRNTIQAALLAAAAPAPVKMK